MINTVLFSPGAAVEGPDLALIQMVSMALQLMSLIAAGFVVAAVLSNRSDAPEAELAADWAAESGVVVDDPLAYDPADFEPPHHPL